MWYGALADFVVLVHIAFVAFVVFGGFLVLRHTSVAWLHLPAAVWGVVIEFTGGVCPLTPLENMLRLRGGEAGYAGGFIDHYLIPLLYPAGLTRGTQFMLGSLVLALNLAVYGLFLVRRRRISSDTQRQES